MAAFDNSAWIGTRQIRPTEAQLAQIEAYDRGLYKVGMGALWRHVHYFQQYLAIQAAISSATVTGISVPQRVPCKVVAVDIGAESSAGSAATGFVGKALLATPTTFANMLEAAVDIHTAVGIMQAGSVTNGSEDVAAGDRLRLSVTATGGAVVGACAVLHCFRL